MSPPTGRSKSPYLVPDELVIAGVPVYGGRIPLLVEPFFQSLKANGTPAAVVSVYGNRHYDDAVLELADYLREDGFVVCAGAACLAEHSFGHEIATGRPDAEDLAKAKEFGEALRKKLEAAEDAGKLTAPEIPGNRPYKARGTAPNTAAPKTTDACIKCGICVKNCPCWHHRSGKSQPHHRCIQVPALLQLRKEVPEAGQVL